jgi:hypothetical protein
VPTESAVGLLDAHVDVLIEWAEMDRLKPGARRSPRLH